MSKIEELKSKVEIESLLKFYGVKHSKNYSWHCPFHEDKSASFLAKPDQHSWRCTVCGIGGDEIEFISKKENLSISESIKQLKKIFNIEDDEKISFYPLQELTSVHFELLSKRGIKSETAKELGYKTIVPNVSNKITKNGKSYNTRIYFPEKRFGFIQSYKYINIEDKTDQGVDGLDKDAKLFPDYNFEGVDTLIIVCGQWDQAVMHQIIKEDYPDKMSTTKVVCMSAGEKSIPKDINRLKKFKDKIKKVYYFADGDKPGLEASELWAKTFTEMGFPFIVKTFPESLYISQKDGKSKVDVNDAYLHHGYRTKEFFNLPEKVYQPNEKIDELEEEQKEKNKDDFYSMSTQLQKSILNYLIVNSDSYFEVKDLLKQELFYDFNCRNIYDIFVERMNSIRVFSFDKLKEIDPSLFKYLLNVEINILNVRELKEKINELENKLLGKKINEFTNKMILLASQSLISSENNKIITQIGLEHANLFQENRSDKKIITSLYDAKNKITDGDLSKVRYLDISEMYPILHTFMGYGLAYGKLHLLAGRPSTGKTTFVTQLLEFIARKHKIALFELEMIPEEIAQQSFARAIPHKFLHSFKKYMYYEDSIDLMREKTTQADKNFMILNGYRTPHDIIQQMIYLYEYYGIDIFALDHFHRMQILGDRRFASEIQARDYWTRTITDACDNYGFLMIMLAQMNRDVEKQNTDPKPKLSHLKGTGALEEDAYTVTFLYSPDGVTKAQSSNKVNALVAKSRGGPAGTEAEFEYDRAKALFIECTESYER